MNSRALTLRHQTRVAIKILIEDDTGTLIYTIWVVSHLLTIIGSISRWLVTTGDDLSAALTDLKLAVQFTVAVFSIGWKAVAFGLGLAL